jgi:hypothetical protein
MTFGRVGEEVGSFMHKNSADQIGAMFPTLPGE